MYTPKNNMCPTISHTYATNTYKGLHISTPPHMRALVPECNTETTQKIKEYSRSNSSGSLPSKLGP